MRKKESQKKTRLLGLQVQGSTRASATEPRQAHKAGYGLGTTCLDLCPLFLELLLQLLCLRLQLCCLPLRLLRSPRLLLQRPLRRVLVQP